MNHMEIKIKIAKEYAEKTKIIIIDSECEYEALCKKLNGIIIDYDYQIDETSINKIL